MPEQNTQGASAPTEPFELAPSQIFSTPAINCVLSQSYPACDEVWMEARRLMSGLVGVDMMDRDHDLIMGDPQALSLAKAASEELVKRLKAMFPDQAQLDYMLRGSDGLALHVVDVAA